MPKDMNKPLRLLIVEDSEDDTILLVRELSKGGYEVVWERVETPESMSQALGRQWDLVIADYVLPAFSGLAALKLLHDQGIDLPFIVVSGQIGEDVAVGAMKAGAHDYILKNNMKRLVPAVERELREVDVRRKRRQAEEELRRHKEHLEELVRERTLELQQLNETLEQSVQERTADLAMANNTLRLLSSRLMAAHEEERKRVACEIHDTIGSCLSAVKFKVEEVLDQFERTAPGAEPLKTIIPVVQESIEECRRIQSDLRPMMLDDLGLLTTLSWFCRRFQTIYSHIRVEQENGIEESEISDDLKIVIYRILQEAMNNIAKHSQANLVNLSLRKVGNHLEFVIRDNGQGFDPVMVLSPERTKRGLGLTSMTERIELSGGAFDVDSAEGKGTIIRASWPI